MTNKTIEVNNFFNQFLLNTYNANLNLTQLENEVLTIISYGDEYEETPTECFDHIADAFNGTKNQLKGVIGSLEKKELIWIGEFPNGEASYHLDCEI